MAILVFTADGLLPIDIFDCTLDEARKRFGDFQGSDRRPLLFARFEEFVLAVQQSNLFEAILIDGRFVTEKSAPNDIDLIAVLHWGHDFERVLPMFEYALVSRPFLRQRFGFDVVLVESESPLYHRAVEFFARVRD